MENGPLPKRGLTPDGWYEESFDTKKHRTTILKLNEQLTKVQDKKAKKIIPWAVDKERREYKTK